MAKLSHPQVIEWFHLAFLQVLRRRLDPSTYVLKGGVNLRYFFDSVRYSEDIDLDVTGVEIWALAEKVDGVLNSEALKLLLRTGGLRVDVDRVSKPKQTETTRRWKVPILVEGRRDPIRTKVEFSDRNGEKRFAAESVPERIVQSYAVTPPTAQHYLVEPSTEQKVVALADRRETQARDVFDLELLLRRRPLDLDSVDAATRKRAADCGLALPYEAFQDQVRPFLDPGVGELYDEDSWESMRLFVANELEGK